MKNKLLALFLMLALVCTALFVVACEPENTEIWPINIANFWGGNEDEETYTVRASEDGKGVTFSYVKSGEWEYAKRSLATEEAAQLAEVKTLVLEGKMTTSTNDPRVTLKIEYQAGINPKEVHFNMSSENATYEWDLTGAELDKAVRLLIFAEGSRAEATGSIELVRFELTNVEINEANDVTKQTPPAPTPTAKVITATDNLADAGWFDSGDGVYTAAQDGSAYNISYNKKSFGWAFAYTLVKGEALSTMKSFHITVQGTAGKEVLVKPYDKVESKITLTGGEDVVSVDLTGVTEVDFTQDLKVILFVEPGVQDATGSVKVIKAEFSTEALAPAPAEEKVEWTAGASLDVNKFWRDGGDGKWTAAEVEGAQELSYVAGVSWSNVYTKIDLKTATFNKLAVTVKGPANTTSIFKIEHSGGAYEYKFENNAKFTGEEQTFVLDLGAGVTGEIVLRVFGDWDGQAAGKIVVKSAVLYNVSALDKVASALVDAGGNRFAIANGKLTYTTANWDTAIAYINLDGIDALTVKVKGISGHTAILKIGNVEQKFETSSPNGVLSGEEQEVVFDVSKLSGIQEFRVFADWDAWADIATVAGELTIVSVKEGGSAPVEEKVEWTAGASLNVNSFWRDGGDGKWTAAEVEGAQELSYVAGVSWSSIYTKIDLKTATFNKLAVTVKGPANTTSIFKIEHSGGAYEYKFENNAKFTGEEQTFVLDLGAGVTGEIVLRVFGDWDGQAAGKIVVKSAVLYNVSALDKIASSLVNAGANRFTIEGNKLTYTIANWDSAVGYVNLDGVNTITVKVKGISGHTAIIKIGNVEQKFESSSPNGVLSGEEQTITFDVSALSGIQEFRVFADWDAWADIATVTGEITIVSVQ